MPATGHVVRPIGWLLIAWPSGLDCHGRSDAKSWAVPSLALLCLLGVYIGIDSGLTMYHWWSKDERREHNLSAFVLTGHFPGISRLVVSPTLELVSPSAFT